MNVHRPTVLTLIFTCLVAAASAQNNEDLALRNWTAPPYWNPALQPGPDEESGRGMIAMAAGMQVHAEALPSSPLPFVAIAPCRIVDTRVAVSDGFHQPNFADDEVRTFNLPTSTDCPGLPATAGAWSLNVQFRPMTQLSFLTAYPTGTTRPGVSTMTAGPAAWVQNAAIVPAGTGGATDVYCQFAGRVIIDVNGYYGPQSVVTSLNSKIGDVTLAEGANVTITPSANTLTIASSGLALPYLGATSSPSAAFDVSNNGSGWAIHGSSSAIAVLGTSSGTGSGVKGETDTGIGVFGLSTNGYGVLGSSNSGYGMRGESNAGPGVYGTSSGSYGVLGETSTTIGVYGLSVSADGVVGQSTSKRGVHGQSSSASGVLGESTNEYGVQGVSTNGCGVYGTQGADEGKLGCLAYGVKGESATQSGTGVYGVANSGAFAYGVWGVSSSGFAGYFDGDVQVIGNLAATGTKPFVIDHPLDPANRELWHAAVESSEVLDIYSGNVVTDQDGRAVVQLPEWFEALNTDFRYQLTCIGRFAQAIVEEEITHNRFAIRTNLAGVKVSWQVTAQRNDAWMRAHPFAAERDKPEAERGTFLTPLEHGQPEARGVASARRPGAR